MAQVKHETLAERFGEYCAKNGKDLSTMDDSEIQSFLRDLTRTYRRKHNKYVTNVELREALGCYPETRILIEAEGEGYVDITPEHIGYMRVELNAPDERLYHSDGSHIANSGGELVLVISRRRINDSPPRPSN